MVYSKKDFNNINVLVTGGSGFIGKHLINKLLDLQANIYISTSRKEFNNICISDKCKYLYCDILDMSMIRSVFGRINISYIFHFAGPSTIKSAEKYPSDVFKINIIGVINILEFAKEIKVKKVIVPSSIYVYGEKQSKQFDEGDSPKDTSPYGVSKIYTEKVSELFNNSFDIPITVLRIGQVFGPGDLNFERLIPSLIKSIINNQVPYIKNPLTTKMNLIYVHDLINAILILTTIKNPVKSSFDIVNVCNTKTINIGDVLSTIVSFSNKNVKSSIHRTNNMLLNSDYSNRKLKGEFNWRQEHSINSALKDTFDYYMSVHQK